MTPTPPINPPRPSFTLEMSESNGSFVHRCECGKTIKRMSDLKRHWNSRRHGGRRFGCFKCRRVYSRRYMLDHHVCRGMLVATGDMEEVDI